MGRGDFYLQNKGVAMGAKHAHSVANLFIDKWEKDVIDAQQSPGFSLWLRYIDDILLLWKGHPTSLVGFMETLKPEQQRY